jgi:hypothetical protein
MLICIRLRVESHVAGLTRKHLFFVCLGQHMIINLSLSRKKTTATVAFERRLLVTKRIHVLIRLGLGVESKTASLTECIGLWWMCGLHVGVHRALRSENLVTFRAWKGSLPVVMIVHMLF